MKRLFLALLGLLIASPALAQWQVPNYSIPIGRGSGITGFKSAAPGAAGNVLTSNGPSADPTFQVGLGWYIVGSAQYPTLQSAVTAASAAGNGNTVFIPGCGTYALGSGAVGLDATSSSALTIRGNSDINGGAGQCVFVTYTGTGTMVDGSSSNGLNISGIYWRSSGAGAKNFNFSSANYVTLHHNMIVNDVSNAGNIGVDLDNSQMPTVRRNVFAVTDGIGVRGVAPAGTFSVKALIDDNVFLTSTTTAISSPGQAWTISNNVSQNPTAFMIAGPATTCDIVHLTGNDIDDIVGGAGKTLVTSNCGVTQSTNNRFGYSGGTTTNIAQIDATGSVISKGDRLSGTVGIDIGTGNYLTIEGYETTAPHAPTTLYTGTPGSTFNVQTVVGPSAFEGDVTIGVDGVRLNRLNFHNATAGTNIFVQPPTGAIGTATNTLPGTTGTLLNSTNSVVVTNKSISGSTNTLTNVPAVTSLIVDDTTTNAVMYPTWVTAATGQLPLKVSSTGLTWNPSTQRMGIGTAAPNAMLQVGGGTDTSILSPPFFVNVAGTASFAVRDSTNNIELGMFTNTSGGGLVAMGSLTSHPFWIQTNAANMAAFHVSTGFSVGNTTDPGSGAISALTTVKATTGFILTNRLSFNTAPTATTFCTSPSIPANNGTAAFTINVGSACATSTGTITMPAATTGWVCDFQNVTSPATSVIGQTGGTTTTVTVTNYVRITGVAGNWTSSDVIRAKCSAY